MNREISCAVGRALFCCSGWALMQRVYCHIRPSQSHSISLSLPLSQCLIERDGHNDCFGGAQDNTYRLSSTWTFAVAYRRGKCKSTFLSSKIMHSPVRLCEMLVSFVFVPWPTLVFFLGFEDWELFDEYIYFKLRLRFFWSLIEGMVLDTPIVSNFWTSLNCTTLLFRRFVIL